MATTSQVAPPLPRGGCGVIGYWRGLTARPAYLHIARKPPNLSIMPGDGGEGLSSVNVETRDDIFPFQRFMAKVGLVFFSDPFQPFQLLRSLPLGRDNVGARTTILRGLASFTSLINRPFFCKINNKKTPTYLPLHRRRLITRSILLFSFFTRST